jgi:hypothetical protein
MPTVSLELDGWERSFCEGCWSLLHPQVIEGSPLGRALKGMGRREGAEPNLVRLDVGAMIADAEAAVIERRRR